MFGIRKMCTIKENNIPCMFHERENVQKNPNYPKLLNCYTSLEKVFFYIETIYHHLFRLRDFFSSTLGKTYLFGIKREGNRVYNYLNVKIRQFCWNIKPYRFWALINMNIEFCLRYVSEMMQPFLASNDYHFR